MKRAPKTRLPLQPRIFQPLTVRPAIAASAIKWKLYMRDVGGERLSSRVFSREHFRLSCAGGIDLGPGHSAAARSRGLSAGQTNRRNRARTGLRAVRDHQAGLEDRKSTRLNSSH